MKYIKKHWFIITIILLCLIRLLISFNLISFYISNLPFDDALMLRQSNSLLSGDYLGLYNNMTLVKGPIFSFLLALIRLLNISYSFTFTILYIISSLFFMFSLKKIIKDKRILLIILAFLLFNPVTYSSELFQRLYRNVLSIPELLFFLGCIINVLFSNKHKILNNISLGFITSIMLLTREDTIWTYIVLIILYGYKIIKYIKQKNKIQIINILISLFPIFIIIINLNIISYINYKHYNIYTYNELNDTSFERAYKKVLEIKDDKKIEKVAIPRTTFEKLTKNSKLLKITEEELEEFYNKFQNEDKEIDNGNVVWYFRNLVNRHNKFKDGEEARKFYNKLSLELDYLFETGVFEKEMVLPSTYLYMPTKKELFEIPKSIIKSIIYTTTYNQVKTLTKSDVESYDNQKYDDKIKSYSLSYKDYRNSANIPKNNPIFIEIIRIIYKYFTIIFSFVALFIYLKNIKKFDNLNIIIDIILISYLVIIFGISYNNATSFPSIRYSYLANIYILQNLFVLLNIYRLYLKKHIRGK